MKRARSEHWIAVATALAVLCAPSVAQNNSIFRHGTARSAGRSAPASQPSGARADLIFPARIVAPTNSADESPPPNPVLLRTSLIAVDPPKPRKIQVHDLITIIVREDKRSNTDSRLRTEKDGFLKADVRQWFKLNTHGNAVPQTFSGGVPGIDLALDAEYNGRGRTERKDSLITRISALIIDVKPNGTLVLEAKKQIGIDADRQIVTLTGVCRATDVTAQNTILSTQVANLQINAQHSGPSRDAARRGWFTRIWDLIRPF